VSTATAVVGRNAFERAVVLACGAVLWLTTCVIFVILATNTLLRYASGSSLQWANEVPELLFPWLVMAGVVLAAEKGAHIATVFLVDAVGAGLRRHIAVASWLGVAALYAVLVRATWGMLEIVHDERSPILQVPGSVTYACVMVGMVLIAALALLAAWRAWRGVRASDDAQEGTPAAQGSAQGSAQ
jgi:TRAP-type C4-dicarboxylate transport system permease small subunit